MDFDLAGQVVIITGGSRGIGREMALAFASAGAKELILLGRNFNACAAKEYGLVPKVVPPDELDTAVARFASKFLKLPPRTVGAAKRVIDVGSCLPLRASQDLEIDAQAELLHSPDFKEAVYSFIEGRPPRFIGE